MAVEGSSDGKKKVEEDWLTWTWVAQVRECECECECECESECERVWNSCECANENVHVSKSTGAQTVSKSFMR